MSDSEGKYDNSVATLSEGKQTGVSSYTTELVNKLVIVKI